MLALLCFRASGTVPLLATGDSYTSGSVYRINLSNDTGQSTLPEELEDPVVSGNNVYVTWSDSTPGNSSIFFRASNDQGSTFGPSMDLSNNADVSIDPRLAASGKWVYLAWSDRTNASSSIMFRASRNYGASFGPVVDLSNQVSGAIGPQIALFGSNVYVAWAGSNNSMSDIFFRESHDNGKTFGPYYILSNSLGVSREVSVKAVGSNVYTTWVNILDGRIETLFRASHDYGATFGSSLNLSATGSGTSREPLLSISKNNVYIVWREIFNNSYEVFVRASHDNGSSFGAAIDLSNNKGVSREAMVSSSGSNVYVMWRDNTPKHFDVFFRASHDNGSTFDPRKNLSGDSGISLLSGVTDIPEAASSGKNVFVAWDDNISGNYEVYLAASGDNGRNFPKVVNLGNDTGASNNQEVAARGNFGYVAWNDITANQSQTDVLFSSVNMA